MKNNQIAFFLLVLSFFSCKKENEIAANVYKEGKLINHFNGVFYATKYGGLNYYIQNDDDRNQLFTISNIDSILFFINGKNYSTQPLVRRAYSRKRNNSDFSFSVNRQNFKIIEISRSHENINAIF